MGKEKRAMAEDKGAEPRGQPPKPRPRKRPRKRSGMSELPKR